MKGRIKRLMRARGRHRMLQNGQDGHRGHRESYALCRRHFCTKPTRAARPWWWPRGKNNLALRIRAMANDSGIPIVENPPLARGLYDSVQVGQEIPVQLLSRAVAEVLAHIYKLMDNYRHRPTHIGL